MLYYGQSRNLTILTSDAMVLILNINIHTAGINLQKACYRGPGLNTFPNPNGNTQSFGRMARYLQDTTARYLTTMVDILTERSMLDTLKLPESHRDLDVPANMPTMDRDMVDA
ncbi:unnamed protein product [Clonostachys byssicola]|uniref:Uncharacterized protein n=1 Tax=Clonostachys byssicola TaxID=160290 RepID=A0A9N9UUB6_9HYPO|nr:unnamed protein product [Clonostachys byssicola]